MITTEQSISLLVKNEDRLVNSGVQRSEIGLAKSNEASCSCRECCCIPESTSLLGAPDIVARCIPAPHVVRGPRHPVPLGDFRRGPSPRFQLGNRLRPLRDERRNSPRTRAPVLTLCRGGLVNPLARHHAALLVAECPRRPPRPLAVAQARTPYRTL